MSTLDEPSRLPAVQSASDSFDGEAAKEQRRYRLAKRLFWLPIIVLIPVFIIVGETIPNVNHGSIGDGFRRLNVFLAIMFRIFALCWVLALSVITSIELPKVPKTRLLILLILFILVAVSVALSM